jgi:hypothetical protein
VFQYRPALITGKYEKVPENIITSSRTILESPAGSNWNQMPDGKKICSRLTFFFSENLIF